jgi:hypothetical protein
MLFVKDVPQMGLSEKDKVDGVGNRDFHFEPTVAAIVYGLDKKVSGESDILIFHFFQDHSFR